MRRPRVAKYPPWYHPLLKFRQVNAASPPPSIERDKEDRGIGRDRESMRIYFRAYMYSLGNDLMCFGSPDRQQSIISVG